MEDFICLKPSIAIYCVIINDLPSPLSTSKTPSGVYALPTNGISCNIKHLQKTF